MNAKTKLSAKEQSRIITWHLRDIGVAIHADEPFYDNRFYRREIWPGGFGDWLPYGVDFQTLECISLYEAHYQNQHRWSKGVLDALENGKYTYSTGWSVWDYEHRNNPTIEITRWIEQNLAWLMGGKADPARLEMGKALAPVVRHAISYIIQHGEKAYIYDFEGVTAGEVLQRLERAE